MNEPSANPVIVALLFILRCLVPLGILFGVSYLLRKLGLVSIDEPEPQEEPEKDEDNSSKNAKES